MTGTFDRVEVERLLGLLSVKLTDRRIAGKVYIVGGAAIALQHDGRRTTDDVDALAAPAGAVGAAAREVAAEEGLPDNWLNDAARAWIPPLPEGQSMDPGSDPGLGIETAPARAPAGHEDRCSARQAGHGRHRAPRTRSEG